MLTKRAEILIKKAGIWDWAIKKAGNIRNKVSKPAAQEAKQTPMFDAIKNYAKGTGNRAEEAIFNKSVEASGFLSNALTAGQARRGWQLMNKAREAGKPFNSKLFDQGMHDLLAGSAKTLGTYGAGAYGASRLFSNNAYPQPMYNTGFPQG